VTLLAASAAAAELYRLHPDRYSRRRMLAHTRNEEGRFIYTALPFVPPVRAPPAMLRFGV
jgi:hypothetical protein